MRPSIRSGRRRLVRTACSSPEVIEKDKVMKSTHALRGLACLLGLFACSAFAADAVIADCPLEAVPPEVAAIVDRQIQCHEWTTLEITDERTDRAAELALTRLRCDRLVAEMTTLRNKYAQSLATLHALDVAGNIWP
jgi:hypothetical protein